MNKKIEIDFTNWNIKLIERTKHRRKLQIKLTKEEALAFKNFTEMVKPPEIADTDFLKGIFKIGIETMESRLLEAVKQHAEEHNIDLSGVGLKQQPEEDAKEEIVVPVMGEYSELKSPEETDDEVQAD